MKLPLHTLRRIGCEVQDPAEREKYIDMVIVKPEGKKPLRRRTHGWEDNIRIEIKETECEIA